MADIFAAGRGCVYHNAGGSAGWYKLEGLGDNDPSILVMGSEITDSDIVLPESCVDNKKVLYVFGQKFGDVRVAGTILCGPGGERGAGGTAYDAVLTWFQGARVTKTKKPVSLSTPGQKSYKIYILGLSFAIPDAEFHTQPFLIYGMIADPPN